MLASSMYCSVSIDVFSVAWYDMFAACKKVIENACPAPAPHTNQQRVVMYLHQIGWQTPPKHLHYLVHSLQQSLQSILHRAVILWCTVPFHGVAHSPPLASCWLCMCESVGQPTLLSLSASEMLQP